MSPGDDDEREEDRDETPEPPAEWVLFHFEADIRQGFLFINARGGES